MKPNELQGAYDRLLAEIARYRQDAVAYRFCAGESVEAISKVYGLSYRDVEQALRDYLNR